MPLRPIQQVESNPVFQAFDPRGRQFLEAQFLSSVLNPYATRSIRVAALSAPRLPHLKVIPAFQMMLMDHQQGLYDDKDTLVVFGSGNTNHAVTRLARAYGFLNVKAVMPGDAPDSKVGILKALSVDVMSVGGGKSVAVVAAEQATLPGHCLIDQYTHEGNPLSHELYTGPEIGRVLDGNVAAVAIAMGTTGTTMGISRYLKKKFPDVVIIGVCPKLGEQVPGARDLNRIAEAVKFLWKKHIDVVIEEVSRNTSFEYARMLSSEVEPQPGPTSGLAYRGLMHYLESIDDDALGRLRGRNVAFLCHDDARFYHALFMSELDTGQGII